MSEATFMHDVFLSHSAQDKAVVRDVAERLRAHGLLNNPQPSTFNFQPPRGSDWAQLESGTFRFRDPLNKERRFLPLRLDDAPIKGSDSALNTYRFQNAARQLLLTELKTDEP